VKIVKPGAEHDTPRGILGGAELSQATTGATNIYMAKFRVPAGARSRPHYHANCESACYMLSGRMRIRWGERLEHTVDLGPGDMLWVPPHETHVLENLSDGEDAEYVVARDSPTEDSVEVPDLLRVDPESERAQLERLKAFKADRDQDAVQRRLADLREAARGTANLLPAIKAALRDRCSIGEVCGAMKDVFGEYQPDF